MLRLENITREYPTAAEPVRALDGVSITFRESEFVAVLGPSGCGKTTLLNIVGGLDCASEGDLVIDGVSTCDYKDADWDAYRNQRVGFVFQSYNLIPHQTVLANVEMALKLSGVDKEERRRRAESALRSVGLGDQLEKKPSMMSGGQMQRVAIARALVNDPDIILADEPTGALDSETSVQVMDLLRKVAKDRLVVMVTHNAELAGEYATRIIRMKDGRVTDDSNPIAAAESVEPSSGEPAPHTHLGFGTALGLSATNLWTKKGRTFLASFAGAIGIIGIALILALSSGVTNYIDDLEEEMMGSSPITLSEQSIDMSNMMTSGDSDDSDSNASDAAAGEGGRGSVPDGGGDMGGGPGSGGGQGGGGFGGMFGGGTGSNDDDDSSSAIDGLITSNNIVARSLESREIEKTEEVENNLAAFKTYLEENQGSISDSLAAVEYSYDIEPQVLRLDDGEVITVSPSSLFDSSGDGEDSDDSDASSASASSNTMGRLADGGAGGDVDGDMGGGAVGGSASVSSQWSAIVDDETLRSNQYELLSGEWPTEYNEVAIVVDEDGQISDAYLYALGLMDLDDLEAIEDAIENDEEYDDPTQSFTYDEVIGLTYQVASTSAYYKYDKDSGLWVDMSDNEDFMESVYENGATLTVTAILQSTDSADVSSGVVYTKALTSYLMDEAADSKVVKAQLKNEGTDVVTGEDFDDDDAYDEALTALGYATEDEPDSISLYPTDIDGKEALEEFIDDYNDQADTVSEQVTYTDVVSTMTSSVSEMVSTITTVLIAFTAISLVVSSIMIAIITYISVLERRKEIGILRAIGASKRDVTRIFNAETFIEGLTSGLLGVIIAVLLCIPINSAINAQLGFEGIASLPPQYALLLILISVVLTFLAGWIPARMAAKKDPAETLRSE